VALRVSSNATKLEHTIGIPISFSARRTALKLDKDFRQKVSEISTLEEAAYDNELGAPKPEEEQRHYALRIS